MFSCISRALRGDSRKKKVVQLRTPNEFDDFLRTKVFEGGINVTRVHVLPDLRPKLEDIINPHTRGLGHQGWRPGHVLSSQRVHMLQRLATEAPDKYQEMVQNNSLIVPDATAGFILEDFDVLLAMARGHDGKNPNHCIRFVWDPTSNRSVVQYKHFCFEEVWRPTLKFSKESGQWIPDNEVRYSWLKADIDLKANLDCQVPPKPCRDVPIPQTVRDNVTKCVSTMANFGSNELAEWNEYFGLVISIQKNPVATIPYVSPARIAQTAADMITQKSTSSVTPSVQVGIMALTSTVGSNTRETLVAAGPAEASAWSNDQSDMRLASRVSRVNPTG